MGKPFTPERLANIRRMRKARRLFKKQPLFAFDILCREYSDYTHERFVDDLTYRTKRKRKKKKSSLVRYGRYRRMEQLKTLYEQTGIVEYALQAQKLRRLMTRPYRVMVRVEKMRLEYSFSELIPIAQIEQLCKELAVCGTVKNADKLVEHFRSQSI